MTRFAALLVLLAACGGEPSTVLVEAIPVAARDCGAEPGPNPPPPDGLAIEVTVDPPGVERWPDVPCRGDRSRVTCERALPGGDTSVTDFRLGDGAVLIHFAAPGRCALDYRIVRLTWR